MGSGAVYHDNRVRVDKVCIENQHATTEDAEDAEEKSCVR
jgi:hypothetical protein